MSGEKTDTRVVQHPPTLEEMHQRFMEGLRAEYNAFHKSAEKLMRLERDYLGDDSRHAAEIKSYDDEKSLTARQKKELNETQAAVVKADGAYETAIKNRTDRFLASDTSRDYIDRQVGQRLAQLSDQMKKDILETLNQKEKDKYSALRMSDDDILKDIERKHVVKDLEIELQGKAFDAPAKALRRTLAGEDEAVLSPLMDKTFKKEFDALADKVSKAQKDGEVSAKDSKAINKESEELVGKITKHLKDQNIPEGRIKVYIEALERASAPKLEGGGTLPFLRGLPEEEQMAPPPMKKPPQKVPVDPSITKALEEYNRSVAETPLGNAATDIAAIPAKAKGKGGATPA